jgi:hypothetical protein
MHASPSITAADLLAIPSDQPERLFGTPDAITTRFRALAASWHPDHTGADAQARDVFAHLVALRDSAREKLAKGIWQTPGVFERRGNDGLLRRVRHLRDFDIGVGRAYLARTLLAAAFTPDFDDLAAKANTTIAAFRFRDENMRRAMAPRLPRLRAKFASPAGTVLVIEKPEPMIRLRDLHAHFGGKVDPRHVAWIVSESLNLACWLEWAGLTHGEISLDSVFIDPASHSAAVLGGWWFAAPVDARITSLPARTLTVAPRPAMDAKRADHRTDLELIRLLARELLGHETGTGFRADRRIHPAVGEWLRLPAAATPRQDYADWQSVLKDSFGARRFTELPISASDIYEKDN